MRIIGGTLRGRSLSAQPFANVRPTTDRVRETVFNIVQNYVDIEGIAVLDICAGSGALGFEALSRGAARCVAIEKHRKTAAALAATARTFGVDGSIDIVQNDALKALRAFTGEQFALIFCDPPYALTLLNAVFSALDANNLAAPGALFVAEHDRRETVLPLPGWNRVADRLFGETRVDFFQRYSVE